MDVKSIFLFTSIIFGINNKIQNVGALILNVRIPQRTRLILGSVLVALSLTLIIGINSFPMHREGLGVEEEQLGVESFVIVDVYRPVDGKVLHVYHHESHNVITNVGLHVIERLLGGRGTWQWTVAEGGNDFYYYVDEPNDIALSSDSNGVDAVHSSWQSVDGSYPSDIEIITGGLERKGGTFTMDVSYTPGSGTTMGSVTYTMSAVFTVQSGSSFTAVQKAGLFSGAYNTNDGLSSGGSGRISPLVAENTFTPVDLNAGDSIAITWSITL